MSLSKNILATICYYDCLDYPLTAFEVWKYLIKFTNYEFSENTNKTKNEKYSLGDIKSELSGGEIMRHIEEFRGFYFLKGQKNLVEQRIYRNKISSEKIKKLRKIAWSLRFIPFVRMIGVTGRLAMKNAEEGSDWDVLVVVRQGKIWTGRTILTAFLHLIGQRRHGKKIKNRVCLNYFVAEDSLEIRNKDLFSSHEYYCMFPLFGAKTYNKFRIKNNWIKEYRPNYSAEQGGDLRIIPETRFSRKIRKGLEFLLGWRVIEEFLGRLEKEKIEKNPKTFLAGGIISAGSDALVFLPEPQGPEIFERFMAKLKSLNIS